MALGGAGAPRTSAEFARRSAVGITPRREEQLRGGLERSTASHHFGGLAVSVGAVDSPPDGPRPMRATASARICRSVLRLGVGVMPFFCPLYVRCS